MHPSCFWRCTWCNGYMFIINFTNNLNCTPDATLNSKSLLTFFSGLPLLQLFNYSGWVVMPLLPLSVLRSVIDKAPCSNVVTARVRSTREGNVLTRVCPSINLSVHRGGYPYPIMLCNISQNAMSPGTPPPGGYRGLGTPPRGVPRSGYPPWGGTEVWVPPRGGTQVRVPPPQGGTQVRYPPGGYQVRGTEVQVPPPPGGGGTEVRVPPRGGTPSPGTPRGGTRVGQQKEYSLHGGRYASCVHAGGLSCLLFIDLPHLL